MQQFERRVVSHGVDGIVIWLKNGPRESDWESVFIDRERDGMSPYERRRHLDRMRRN